METLTEQERSLEKLTAEAHGLLSLGFFRTALVPDNYLILLGVIIGIGGIFLISGINLGFFHRWKRKKILNISSRVNIRHVAWFLGFILLGTGLIQKSDCLFIPGIICICIGYIILGLGIGTDLGTIINSLLDKLKIARKRTGGHLMGSKGRKNVKKPKQDKGKKAEEKKK